MVLRFGPFELDADREELRKSGLLLRLPHQPARLLLMLIAREGEVVTREEIQQEIWGNDTHVDFEQGINAAIRQIRFHLGDNAEAPRYLKTIPRRGYVWIAPVEEAPSNGSSGSSVPRGSSGSSGGLSEAVAVPVVAEPPPRSSAEPEQPGEPKPRPRRRLPLIAAAIVAVLAIAAAATWSLYPRNRRTVAVTEFRAIGALPAGVDPRTFTGELRSTLGMLPPKYLRLVEDPSDAQVRVEGTIQRSADGLRVIVSGIDTASRTQLWTEAYERRLGEHHNLAMQTAHLVSHEAARRLLPPPRHEPLLRTKVSPRALELYRQARIEQRRSFPGPEGNRAKELFEQALKQQPNFPEALSGLADVWAGRAGMVRMPKREEAAAKARELSARALALQPDNAEALIAKGAMALQYDWDLTAAEQFFRQAVELDPEYVDAHYSLCIALAARGEINAALEEYEQARSLDPIDYDLHPAEGMLYIRGRRYDEAIAKYREILRFRDSVQSRWGILWAAAKKEDWEEALSVLRPMLALGDPKLELPARPTGAVATKEQYVDLFRRLEPVMLAERERGTFDHYHVAAYYSMRGDLDSAFAALERSRASRSPAFAHLMADPRFDNLRNDPRYPAFARLIK
ncbi:MAG TPA: winged helix-turn-helix domain-containing protein [Thermoanaerobaculia bacterium]